MSWWKPCKAEDCENDGSPDGLCGAHWTLDHLSAENAELKARIEQYESEDSHEAMDCYVTHQQLDRMKSALKEILEFQYNADGTLMNDADANAAQVKIARKALDEGRCKHGVDGEDCFECYPSDDAEKGRGDETDL